MNALMLITLLVSSAASPLPAPRPDVAAWRADLRLLARELPGRHPAPFLHITRAQWDSASTSLERRLPSMSRNQALVGFLQLVALIGDAHTNLEVDSLGLRFY